MKVKKLFALLLAMIMLCQAASGIGAVYAETPLLPTDSGTCGDNAFWEYFAETETLSIYGTGAITSSPWDDAVSGKIKKIIVESEIQEIGVGVFQACTSIEEITLPFVGTSKSASGYEAVFGAIFGWETTHLSTSYSGYPVYEYTVSLINSVDDTQETRTGFGAESYSNAGYAFMRDPDGSRMSSADTYDTVQFDYKWSRPHAAYIYKAYANFKYYYYTLPTWYGTYFTWQYTSKDYGCSPISYYYYIPQLLRTVSITNSNELPLAAFNGCGKIETINVYTTAELSIGKFALQNCNATVNQLYGTYPFYTYTNGLDTYTYCISDQKATVIKCETENEVVNVPDCIDGYPVAAIGQEAFANCETLKSVILPASVTKIDDYAFNGCTSLTSIALSDNITEIGAHAFGQTALVEIELPTALCSIGDYAFSSNTALTSIGIKANLQTLGEGAFDGCTSLEGVTLPDGLTLIGEKAFRNCASLAYVNIPDSVTEIGTEAFTYCSSLSSIAIPNDTISIGAFVFRNCTKLKDIYCEVHTQPEKWNANWIGACNATVHWGICSHSETTTEKAEPTCEEDGYMTVTCNACGEVVAHEVLPAHGHDGNTVLLEPTCETGGYNTTTCTVCGKAFFYEVIPALGHVETTVTVEPTCEEDGYTRTTCDRCGKELFYETAPALGHTKVTVTVDATCTADGNTVTECATCGREYSRVVIPALGHAYQDGICSVCGSRDPSVCLHENCDTVEPEEICTKAGERVTICRDCEAEVKRETVPAAGHAFDSGTCVRCGAECGMTLQVSDAQASAGETVTVDIVLDKNVGFTYIKLGLVYDTDALELVSVTNGTVIRNLTQGKFYVWADAKNATSTGVLATLTFAVKDNTAAGDYAVSVNCIECCNADEQDVLVEVVGGTLTVVDFVYGDANGDGEINGKDVTRLLRYLASYDPETDEATVEIASGADCNGDGIVNGKDVTRLLRYIANLDPETGDSSVILGPSN